MAVMPTPNEPWTTRVVGVSFVEGYPRNLTALSRSMLRHGSDPVPASLRRRPDNPHDANAIEVHVQGYGQIGHLPRDIASDVAPDIDAGHLWAADVIDVHISSEDLENEHPGVVIRLWRAA